MASDISGEIYVVSRKDGRSVDSVHSATVEALGKKQYAIKIPNPPVLRLRKETGLGYSLEDVWSSLIRG